MINYDAEMSLNAGVTLQNAPVGDTDRRPPIAGAANRRVYGVNSTQIAPTSVLTRLNLKSSYSTGASIMSTADHRLAPEILADDESAYNNLITFTDYHPANAQFALALGHTLKGTYDTARAAEDVAKRAFEAARDSAVAAEQALHDYIQGARTQVEAQYGPNSDQLQAMGRKKKSEYKKSSGRKAKA